MKKYELTHGTCETCCFRKGIHGVSICKREENTECTPGITCYTEVPTTNGDRIRSMSNEELAKYFADMQQVCPPWMDAVCGYNSCEECWLNWLNAEARR